ncbi:TIGR02281 family clan AA aspartic protease [Pseudorhodoferax sp. Leaf267]|uniref:retropepsin-like aspartic protease family protein n=1 Tax=Pseudorhodoferax sp. Leaf267 TaxID=1736316 RepID=UPI0006FBC992|nr:retropepsin-like aspartic protease [Pseudorhodoferax sp. Leaf267]KQP18064.1 peptidase A2 [Pseudorhodoferax sp. Leaf267]
MALRLPPTTAALLAAALWGQASAQTVGLAGVMGQRALLMVDGGTPRSVAVGDSYQGIKVVALRGDQADLEIGGKRLTLRMGESPASVGARGTAGTTRIVLTSDSRGHFISQGRINGKLMQFMVDTGATTLAISAPEAERMGIAYRNGQPVNMSTANGVAQGWRVQLDTVRVGDVELSGLEAVVVPMPLPYVLLGNNFLGRFQMTRSNEQMVLERRP